MKLTTISGKGDLEKVKKTAAMIGADRIVLVSSSNRTIKGKDAIIIGVKGVLNLVTHMG